MLDSRPQSPSASSIRKALNAAAFFSALESILENPSLSEVSLDYLSFISCYLIFLISPKLSRDFISKMIFSSCLT